MLDKLLRSSYDNGAFLYENYVDERGKPIALTNGYLFNKSSQYNISTRSNSESVYVHDRRFIQMNLFDSSTMSLELYMCNSTRVELMFREIDLIIDDDTETEISVGFDLFRDEAEFFQYSVSTDQKILFTFEEQRAIIRFYEKMVAFADLQEMIYQQRY